MAEIKRDALLKELSRKLEDQGICQSSGIFRTISTNSRDIRIESRRKHHILFDQAGILTESLVRNPEQ